MTALRDALSTFAADDDGEWRWGLGGLLIFKVPAARTAGRFTVIEERMVRGCATPPHRHAGDDETFVVLEGTLALWVDGVVTVASPGAVAFVPRGVVHAWRVESKLARTLVITTEEHERFYRAATHPAAAAALPPDAGVVDIPTVRAAAEAHGVELLGPIWQGDLPELFVPELFVPEA